MTDFSSWSEHTARKPRKCEQCRTMIGPGTKYTRYASVFDGHFSSTAEHIECRAVFVEYGKMACLSWEDEWPFVYEMNEPEDLIWLREEHPAVADRLGIPTNTPAKEATP